MPSVSWKLRVLVITGVPGTADKDHVTLAPPVTGVTVAATGLPFIRNTTVPTLTEVSRLAMAALVGGEELVEPRLAIGRTVEPFTGEVNETFGRKIPGSGAGTNSQ